MQGFYLPVNATVKVQLPKAKGLFAALEEQHKMLIPGWWIPADWF